MASANIFQEYLKPVRSVADYGADLDKAEAGRMELSEKRSVAGEKNALRALLSSGVDLNTPDGQNKLMAAAPTAGGAILKQRAEIAASTAKAGMETAHGTLFGAQTEEAKRKTDQEKRDRAVSDISAFNSPQEALASLQAHEAKGDIKPEQAAMLRSQISGLQSADAFKSWQLQMIRGIMTPKDRMAHMEPDANNVNTNTTSRQNNADTIAATNARWNSMTPAQRAHAAAEEARVYYETGERPRSSAQANPTTSVVRPQQGPVIRSEAPNELAAVSAINAGGGAPMSVQVPPVSQSNPAPSIAPVPEQPQSPKARDAAIVAGAKLSQPFEVEKDGKRILVRQDRQGNITEVEGYGAKSQTEKALPAAAATKLFENQTNLRRAEQALSLIQGKDVGEMKGDKDATGWKGYLPDAVLQRQDKKGVDARAAIADLGSLVIHERSGAAVTASEFPRLQPFIPSPKDSPATVEKKLKRFVQVYKQEVESTKEYYQSTGYKVPTGATKTEPAKGGAKFLGYEGKAKFLGFE